MQVVLHIPNQVQPAPFGAAAVASQAVIVTNDAGQVVGQPAYTQMPLIPEDFTEEFLATINAQLLTLGLTLSKIAQ